MKIYKIILSVLLSLGSFSAQTFVGNLNPFPSASKKMGGQSTLKILAVMVEFQEDKNTTTSGNGKFGTIYSKDYGPNIIDPLPHDKSFFEDHLLFAQNYFLKASNGNLNITYDVLPEIVTVSKDIKEYTPPAGTDDFSPLAGFVSEVWTIADQNIENFDFGNYDLFAIFHAGVGKDVSVPGSIGNEKDLPSVYLSLEALKKHLGQSFQGVPVNSGNNFVTNSMVLPETENRELEGFSGTVLLELSFNGLLVASIASHLGLPDLFDTETGLSAIGRFGLMDGQSIFAYSGLFPPELSAWEKVYMGWAEPVVADISITDYTLANHLIAAPGETTMLKVPINDKEYFLMENRQRDANNDGLIITYRFQGETHQRFIEKDTTGFYSWGVDTISGVVIDVDEFDWAVPGNGIAIWHIDENIIEANIADNKINIDKLNRGVDLEEADGVQDIGEQFTTITGDVVIGEGWDKDFWFAGNDAELFTNKFNSGTRPSTNSNTGAESLINISDFSAIGNKMSFKLSYENNGIVLLATGTTEERVDFLSTLQDSGQLAGQIGNALINLNTGEVIGDGTSSWKSESKLASAATQTGDVFYFGTFENTIYVSAEQNGNRYFADFVLDKNIKTNLIIKQAGIDFIQIAIADEANQIKTFTVSLTSGVINISEISTVPHPTDIFNLLIINGEVYPVANADFGLSNNGLKKVIGSATAYNNLRVVGLSDSKFTILGSTQVENEFELSTDEVVSDFILADIIGDGNNYIVFADGDKLQALNYKGVAADNFPFTDPFGKNFTGRLLSVDLNGDDNTDIIAFTEDGRIFAISGNTGEVLNGFPLSAGSGLSCTASLTNFNGSTILSVATVENNFYSWKISEPESYIFWAEELGNTFNTSFVNAPRVSQVDQVFFPADKAYNWPNPVYGNETYFRYFVFEDSDITIKIFDLAGDFVDELTDHASGGIDNETTWNVNDIQSGVYFAHLQVKTQGGKSYSKIIKVAIIK